MKDLKIMQINIYHIFLLYLVLTINPIIGGTIDAVGFFYLLILVFSTTFIGVFLNRYLRLVGYNSLANIFLGFLIGSTIFSVLLPIVNDIEPMWRILLNISLILAISLILYINKDKFDLVFKFDMNGSLEILLLIVVFFFLLGVPEYISATSLGNKDNTYFTTVVASLTVNPMWLTLNESGSFINYQIVSFLSPAVVSKFSDVSSHVALWNVVMPFYLILFGVLLAELMRTIPISKFNKNLIIPFTVILFIGLMPIHLKNLVSLKWFDLYLPGMGALLPGGNPPVTLAMSIALIIFLYVLRRDFSNLVNYKQILFVAFLTALILPTKKAAFPSMAVFIVIFYFLQTKNILKSILLSFSIIIIGYIGLKISVPISGATKVVISPGFLIEYYGKTQSWVKNSLITVMFLFTFSFIKWIVFLYYRFRFRYDQYIIHLFIASVSGLFIALLLPLMLRAYIIDSDGTIIQDMTFDTLQFARFGFFLLTIVAVIMTWIIIDNKKQKFITVILVGYIIVMSFSVLHYSFVNVQNVQNIQRLTYYDEVERELDGYKAENMLYASFATDEYLPQVFVADNYGEFFVTSSRAFGGYAMTVEHSDRWYLMEEVEKALKSNNIILFEESLASLQSNNVGAIIFNPDNIIYLNNDFLEYFESSDGTFVKVIKGFSRTN